MIGQAWAKIARRVSGGIARVYPPAVLVQAGKRGLRELAMAQNKTKPTDIDPKAFIAAVEPDGKREDAETICLLMERPSGYPPKMWGPSIVGFGQYHYKYESGREGDSMLTGFSPRKSALTLYIMAGFPRHEEIMARLGKHKTGQACLYVKRLSDIDMEALGELIAASLAHMREKCDVS
jgi:hypothetical protein